MKQKILEILKIHTDYLSLEYISAQLQIPGILIIQEIDELKAAGYEILSSASGYKINNHEDLLLPWEFPGMETLIHYIEQVDSTMQTARELVKQECPDHTIVIAGSQLKGRGRMSRQWDSNKGGLYFTLILRRLIDFNKAYLYNFAAAISLVLAFRELLNTPVSIKWPNDIQINGKKVSGILLELGEDSRKVPYLNIGIGVNVNNDPAPELLQATSLKREAGKNIQRKAVLSSFLTFFDNLTRDLVQGEIITQFKHYCSTTGKAVTIQLPGGKNITGKALDIDANGALRIIQENGEQCNVYYGDCIYL